MHTVHGWLSEKQRRHAVRRQEGTTCLLVFTEETQKSLWLIAKHREDRSTRVRYFKAVCSQKLERTENTSGQTEKHTQLNVFQWTKGIKQINICRVISQTYYGNKDIVDTKRVLYSSIHIKAILLTTKVCVSIY